MTLRILAHVLLALGRYSLSMPISSSKRGPGRPGSSARWQSEFCNDRLNGPAPDRASYRSFATFSDPDGNRWLLQEVTTRLPGRIAGETALCLVDGPFAGIATCRKGAEGAREANLASDSKWSDWHASTWSASNPAKTCRNEPNCTREIGRSTVEPSKVRFSARIRAETFEGPWLHVGLAIPSLGPIYRDLPGRKRKIPRRRTGSGRVRERLDAVEIPLNSTNQSQNACHRFLFSLKGITTSPETFVRLLQSSAEHEVRCERVRSCGSR